MARLAYGAVRSVGTGAFGLQVTDKVHSLMFQIDSLKRQIADERDAKAPSPSTHTRARYPPQCYRQRTRLPMLRLRTASGCGQIDRACCLCPIFPADVLASYIGHAASIVRT